MNQILVRELPENVVTRLKQEAAREGVSMEEEARRILQRVLLGTPSPVKSFKDYLLEIPPGDDDLLESPRTPHRQVEL